MFEFVEFAEAAAVGAVDDWLWHSYCLRYQVDIERLRLHSHRRDTPD